MVNLPVTVSRAWLNNLIHFQPAERQSGGPVGCGVLNAQVVVPVELPPGRYRILYRFEYVVSPVSFPRIVEAETVTFEVIR